MLTFDTRFLPIRANHLKDSYVTLIARVINKSDQDELASLDVIIRNGRLGLEPTLVHKKGTKKLGEIKAGEEKEAYIRIYLDKNTRPGIYEIEVNLIRHYKDYDHIIDVKKKIAELRVI